MISLTSVSDSLPRTLSSVPGDRLDAFAATLLLAVHTQR